MPPAAPGPRDTVGTLLAALHADPADHGARLALADALEEAGRAEQAEVARLHARQLMRVGSPEELTRLCALLEGGVRPVVPEVVNSVGMRFALIPPGTFLMGSPEGEENRVATPTARRRLAPIWGGPARWAATRRTPSGCTTCTATSGSGAPTGTRRTTSPAARRTTRRGLAGA